MFLKAKLKLFTSFNFNIKSKMFENIRGKSIAELIYGISSVRNNLSVYV